MKKYIAPDLEIVLFQTNADVMDDTHITVSGSDYSDPRDGANGYNYAFGTQGSTIVNNNGVPTVIPGGNGGGRQTPLG